MESTLETDTTLHERFALTAQASPAGQFEILAITAGQGNGWTFPREALEASLPLWEGVETFIDHGPLEGGRSLRDLAGICHRPAFDPDAGGIRLSLRATGPSGALLEAAAREWLESPAPRPDLGFSADLLFTAEGTSVRKILKVLSLDLVVNPARGGRILRALNQSKGDLMEPKLDPSTITQPPDSKRVREEKTPLALSRGGLALSKGGLAGALPGEGVRPLLNPHPTGEQPPSAPLHEGAEAEGSDEMHILKLQVSAYLLETALNSAHLPVAATAVIRRRFAGTIFDPAELNASIDEARSLAAELAGGTVIQGSPRVEEMSSSEDRLQAAVDDLLGAPREPGMAGKPVERLSGIRELYLSLTGDYELRGGCDPNRARLATTATLPNLVKNAMNKIIVDQWEQLGRAGYAWWEPVVSIQHFTTLQSITGILVGEVGELPEVGEGADYTELPIADSGETGAWHKYGGYLPLTIELIDRDDLARLRTYPRKLANAALRRISTLVASIFTGTGLMMADGGALFNATPVLTPGGHANLGTAALSPAAWEAAGSAVYSQPMLTASGEEGPRLALDPKYLLVPRALRLTGMRILYPSFERESNIFSENLQRGEFGDVITVPDWQDANDWAAACDPRLAPAVIIGERFGMLPEIFIAGDPLSPALFANDEVRLKVRHFLSVFVADYRPLFKANVA